MRFSCFNLGPYILLILLLFFTFFFYVFILIFQVVSLTRIEWLKASLYKQFCSRTWLSKRLEWLRELKMKHQQPLWKRKKKEKEKRKEKRLKEPFDCLPLQLNVQFWQPCLLCFGRKKFWQNGREMLDDEVLIGEEKKML